MTFTASELAAEAGVRKHGVGFLQKALTPVADWRQGWRIISEAFAGAWQRNIVEKQGDLTCYPTLYACLNRLATDIGKLPFQLKELGPDGIWRVNTTNTSYWPVLRKPNGFQTQQQFREVWTLSKLQDGNTYVLKERDARGVVVRLYVLDPCRVTPMVSDSGAVFYQVNYPTAQNLLPAGYPNEQLMIPARDIIHDRMNCFHHQLLGVPPLCAAALAAGKNLKILRNSASFFANGASPGGLISAPAGMNDEDAAAVKKYWNENFQGENAGKVAVIGADMKFTPFAFKSSDSQLVEQLRYSDEQICQPFGIHPFIVGIGTIPAGLKTDDITNTYYQFALQGHIEAMESLLDEGLDITKNADGKQLGIELDLEPLLRMDVSKQAEVETKLVGGKIKTPDEARQRFSLAPTGGGNTLWGQNQDYPLGMLADRASWDPQMQAPVPTQPEPDEALSDDEMDAEMEAEGQDA